MTQQCPQISQHVPVWQAYEWSGADPEHISRHLARQRARIAQLLEIGLEDVEARRVFSDAERKALSEIESAVEKLTAIRRGGDIEVVATIDVAIEEIADRCLACCVAIVNDQALASSAAVYRTLEEIAGRDLIDETEIEYLDPQVRFLISYHYPVDRQHFAPGRVQVEHVREGALAALRSLEPPTRGRPKGTPTALRPFIEGLISIYDSWASKPATRSVKFDYKDCRHKEQGHFLEFCEIAFDALPAWTRPKLLKSGGSLASAVRQALEIKRARKPRAIARN